MLFPVNQSQTNEMRMQVPAKKLVLFFLAGIVCGCSQSETRQIQVYPVTRGEFWVNVVETGELSATNSKMVSAPSISWRFGDMKITKLAEDGTEVKEGDVLVEMDPAEVQKSIIDAKAELEIAQAELNKTRADQDSKIQDLEADLKMAEISYQISTLELEQSKYKADIEKKEIQLQLDQAKISLDKARSEIENQKQIHQEEINKQQLQITQLKTNLDDAYRTLEKLSVKAPGPGLVIIETNWSTDNKWQVGEQPWSGVPLISLPDLREIKATTEINEVDISKIKLDQRVRIRLDAFPDTTFTGKVTNIAALAKNKTRKSKVKVFPVEVLLTGTHHLLMPGMTVRCDIQVDKLDSVLFVPLDGLFNKEGKKIVFQKKGNAYKAREVTTGQQNNDYVVIESGLEAGIEIALSDPTLQESDRNSAKEAKK